MPLSLEELITPITKSVAYQTFLDLLEALEFPVTGWQSGNPARSISDAIAELYSSARDSVQLVARGGYTKLATGDWLDLLIASQFADEEGVPLVRKEATFAVGSASLTAAAGAGPHTISIGQLTAKDSLNRRFRNTTGGTLPLGGSLALQWQSESPGSTFNLGNNTLTILETPLAGVSINNPGPGGGVSWLTEVGSDKETDAQYAARAPLQWAVLAEQSPRDAYVAWALKADPALRKVFVDDQNPGGPGTVFIWLANDLSTALPGQVTNVSTYIEQRRAISSIISYFSAPEVAVPIEVTVYSKSAFGLTAPQVEAAIDAFFAALDIGGETIQAIGSNRVFRDRIEFAIRDASEGVQVVNLVQPATDVVLSTNELAVPSYVSVQVVQV